MTYKYEALEFFVEFKNKVEKKLGKIMKSFDEINHVNT